jgi:TolB protein
MQADGSAPTNLSNSTEEDAFPRWSPDGTNIAWGHNSGDGSEVYVMGADGSHPTRLTNMPEGIGGQRWSLNGSQIIFDSAGDIYVINADGSSPIRLTDNPSSDSSPMFKP